MYFFELKLNSSYFNSSLLLQLTVDEFKTENSFIDKNNSKIKTYLRFDEIMQEKPLAS